MEMDCFVESGEEVEKKYKIVSDQLEETKLQKAKNEEGYNNLQDTIQTMDEQIASMHEELSNIVITK